VHQRLSAWLKQYFPTLELHLTVGHKINLITLRRGLIVNKAELIDAVAGRGDVSKREVTEIVDAFVEEIKKAVVRGDKVAISGFGIFESQDRKARLGRNPRTGETVQIKATKLPKFRPGAEFKAVVSGAKKISTAAPKKAAAKK
jgi:DNA-binding protein HU-beta